MGVSLATMTALSIRYHKRKYKYIRLMSQKSNIIYNASLFKRTLQELYHKNGSQCLSRAYYFQSTIWATDLGKRLCNIYSTISNPKEICRGHVWFRIEREQRRYFKEFRFQPCHRYTFMKYKFLLHKNSVNVLHRNTDPK